MILQKNTKLGISSNNCVLGSRFLWPVDREQYNRKQNRRFVMVHFHSTILKHQLFDFGGRIKIRQLKIRYAVIDSQEVFLNFSSHDMVI